MKRTPKGQVEREQRIDSFDSEGRCFFVGPFDTLRFERQGKEIRIGGYRISLDYVHNAAGRLTFFLCPYCGRRVRYLYLPEFKCRLCAQLNYRCQQTAKGSRDALQSIPAKIGAEIPPEDVMELDGYFLERPPYMRRKRFAKYEQRFEKHRAEFEQKELGRLFKILSFARVDNDNGGNEEMAFPGLLD